MVLTLPIEGALSATGSSTSVAASNDLHSDLRYAATLSSSAKTEGMSLSLSPSNFYTVELHDVYVS